MSSSDPLPQLRFDIAEVARILRISRATLYGRIREGRICTQKDGRRTFVTAAALQRYVNPSR
jgi:excisionase family DNA binding protein